MFVKNKVKDIRNFFRFLRRSKNKSDNGTYEIINACFIADEPTIYGKLNEEYAKNEVDWYMSKSLSIKDLPGKIPKIWTKIADSNGKINSNYGWCIFSSENFYQFNKVIDKLENDINTRQGTMIYIRPSMHEDAIKNGMKDFMCTYGVQLIVNNKQLHYIVYMRSNDAIFGYKNDRYWHNVVFHMAMNRLQKKYPFLKRGKLFWNAASLHIYPRHFYLLEDYNEISNC